MNEIEVTTQEQLDKLPLDYHGRIYIKFGTPSAPAVVNVKYDFATVEALGNSYVEAWENSHVVALENSSVVAWGNSYVEALGNSYVEAWENSHVVALENSSVVAWGNSYVEAWENSHVVALENSSVVAWGNSSVVAWENSHVEAWENSSVVAFGNSSVGARGNSQINQKSDTSKIVVSGNARIVHDPRTIEEYVDFYGIKNSDGKARLFKAVRKYKDGTYHSDWDRGFIYTIGETVKADDFNMNPDEECGSGIHMAYPEWCVKFGCHWSDFAILEIEADMNKIVVPKYGSGKVRAPYCKVIREVPLEECGLLGKMIANKRKDKV